MNTLYHPAAPSVNPLPPATIRFYRYLTCLTDNEHGMAFAFTRHYARKFAVTERTVYNWLRALEEAGWIERVVVEGVRRFIRCLAPVPPKKKRAVGVAPPPARAVSGGGAVSPLSPYTGEATTIPALESDSKSLKENPSSLSSAAAADPVVAEIEKTGVCRPVAARLAAADPQECRRQLLYLPYRTLTDRAAGFVASVTQKWSPPAKYRISGQNASPGQTGAFTGVSRPTVLPAYQAPPVNGLTGRAAFEALREKVRLGGRAGQGAQGRG